MNSTQTKPAVMKTDVRRDSIGAKEQAAIRKVQASIDFLNENSIPFWHKRVDGNKVILSSGANCILGQIYTETWKNDALNNAPTPYEYGLRQLNLSREDAADMFAFNLQMLQQNPGSAQAFWRKVNNERAYIESEWRKKIAELNS